LPPAAVVAVVRTQELVVSVLKAMGEEMINSIKVINAAS
jgi:hypothetical protein